MDAEEVDVTPSRRRPVLRTSAVAGVAAAVVTGGVAGVLTAGVRGVAVAVLVVSLLVGLYLLHVWLSGWRFVLAVVLALPSAAAALLATAAGDEREPAVLGVMTAVVGLAAWGTTAIAVAVRNRWGNADATILDSLPDW